MSSYDEASTGKAANDSASLAARRARLRPSLVKQALSPDPYQPNASLISADPNQPNQDEQNATVIDTDNSAIPLNPAPFPKNRSDKLPNGEASEQFDNLGADEKAPGKETDQVASKLTRRMNQSGGDRLNVRSERMTQSFGGQDETVDAPELVSFASRSASTATTANIASTAAASANAAAQEQVIEILNNMDQVMNACATNLATLQRIAGEQTEALRALAKTLQEQTFSELGLNLTSLMEALSSACGPMQGVGQLVPAIGELVSAMEAKAQIEQAAPKLSADQLVMNLADQLVGGVIDSWTFKNAYMAVYPADHPADLLHRLVDLLGTQRLSGDMFRQAYDAVQTTISPHTKAASTANGGQAKSQEDTLDQATLEELEQLRKTQREFEEKMINQEKEFSKLLQDREKELQEAQKLLNARREESHIRQEELAEGLKKSEELLQEKTSELARKESENAQLRVQMEEMTEQTQMLMSNMHKQLTPSQSDAQAKPTGFFDTVPKTNATVFNNREAATGVPISESGPISLPAPESQNLAQNSQQISGQHQVQATHRPQEAAPAAPASHQAVSRPAPANQFVSGSFGSGVRAQVFEVIVRQAFAGAPWREMCAGPMQVNNISPEEVEAEVQRRQALLNKK